MAVGWHKTVYTDNPIHIRVRSPTRSNDESEELDQGGTTSDISQMRRCDHQEVDGDPTVAGAKTNTTALELAISKI